jgi:hypothetical protein
VAVRFTLVIGRPARLLGRDNARRSREDAPPRHRHRWWGGSRWWGVSSPTRYGRCTRLAGVLAWRRSLDTPATPVLGCRGSPGAGARFFLPHLWLRRFLRRSIEEPRLPFLRAWRRGDLPSP